MKRHLTVIFIIITLLLPNFRAIGQQHVVSYQYDDSGNRVCQRAMQVTPYNPKTGFGDSMAQNVSSQSDTMSQTQFSRLYSQTTLAIKNDDVNNYGFPEAYVLPTTPQQDEKARDSFKEETEKRYDLLFHNCATVAGNAIIAAGVSTGRKTSLTNFSNERNRHPIMPQALFNSVQKNNPSGHLVTRKQQ